MLKKLFLVKLDVSPIHCFLITMKRTMSHCMLPAQIKFFTKDRICQNCHKYGTKRVKHCDKNRSFFLCAP